MRRILIPVAVVAVVLGLVIAWWLGRSGDDRAKAAKTASGASTPGARAKSREPAKPATVSGRVTKKSDGAGVPGAIVSLVKAELGADMGSVDTPTIIATTDASGAWTAKDVPPTRGRSFAASASEASASAP